MENRKTIIVRIALTVLTAAAIAAIFFNSSRSSAESTEMSSPLTDMFNRYFTSLPIPFSVTETAVRKAAHFSEYAVLGTLLTVTVYLYTPRRRRALLRILPAGAAVAVCDELIQLFPEGRSCEARDVLIDFCGVLCAALLITLLITRYRRNKGKKEKS